MKNNLKKKIYKFLLNERDRGSEADARDAAKEAATKGTVKKSEQSTAKFNASKTPAGGDDPTKPPAGGEDPTKPPEGGEDPTKPPENESGKNGKPYSYNRVEGDSVPYHSNADLVKKIQQTLTDISGEYSKMLQQGDPRYGGSQTLWRWPIDGNYGPRTDIALTAFYKVEKDINRNPQEPITAEVLKLIKTVSTSNSKMTPAKAENAATNAAAATSEKKESVSYKKDLLKPTKNRHKEVEKLVFERLVKNANRL